MKLWSKLIHVALLGTSSLAHAEAGWYAQLTVGLANQGDQSLLYTPANVRRDAALGSGALGGGGLGYAFGNGWRVEAEFVYQSVDMDSVDFGSGLPRGDGNYASTSVALNALYEVDLFGSPTARTYIGAGFARITEVDIDFESGGIERSFSGSDSALQVLIGARYDIGESSFLDAGVRYLAASDIDLDGEDGAVGRVSADYQPWAFTLSWGWRF